MTPAEALDRRSLLATVSGRVLEIGPGRGVNLPHYRPDVEWTGLEPAAGKHRSIRVTARRLGREITLHRDPAEAIPLPDASVDAVVATFVLCSVTDAARCLQEIRRVLRPGSPFVFLEHVGAPKGTFSRRLQDGWARLQLGHCRPNRETASVIEAAGFAHVAYTTAVMRPLGLQVPVIRGTATSAS